MHHSFFRLIQIVGCSLALFSVGPALRAQGGPPFITDDPGTPGDGHWEINTAWTHERRPGLSASELPLLDINYGLGPRIQLKFEVPYLTERAAGEPQKSALGDSLVGVKWRFVDQEQHGVSISTYPQFGARTPGSSAFRQGLVDGGTTLILPLEFSRDLGEWSATADIGRVLRSRSDNDWFAGIVVGRDVGRHCQLAAELHAEGDSSFARFTRSVLVANVGGHYEFSDRHILLFSVGREVRNRDEPSASLLFYLGWQLRL